MLWFMKSDESHVFFLHRQFANTSNPVVNWKSFSIAYRNKFLCVNIFFFKSQPFFKLGIKKNKLIHLIALEYQNHSVHSVRKKTYGSLTRFAKFKFWHMNRQINNKGMKICSHKKMKYVINNTFRRFFRPFGQKRRT